MKLIGHLLLWPIVGFFGLAAVGSRLDPQKTSANSISAAKPPASTYMTVTPTWSKGGFGTVAIASFMIENGNDQEVFDPVLECSFYGNSGSVITTKTQPVYERFGPKTKKTVRNINLGFISQQASSGSCRVMSVRTN